MESHDPLTWRVMVYKKRKKSNTNIYSSNNNSKCFITLSTKFWQRQTKICVKFFFVFFFLLFWRIPFIILWGAIVFSILTSCLLFQPIILKTKSKHPWVMLTINFFLFPFSLPIYKRWMQKKKRKEFKNLTP